MQVSQHSHDIVQQYLALPDRLNFGKGMIAGGSLSPLLGAVLLTPLNKTMEAEIRTGRVWYIRYMDDFVLLAKTRHQFRKAIKQVHTVMRQLKLMLHKEQKCFIGKTETGFDFLSYLVCPNQRLHPSALMSSGLDNARSRCFSPLVYPANNLKSILNLDTLIDIFNLKSSEFFDLRPNSFERINIPIFRVAW